MRWSFLELKIVDGAAVERAAASDLQDLSAADRVAVRDAAAYFMQSYRGMRLTIGAIAFALPWVLILVDLLFTDTRQVRGSMSAYYHSSARDVFVGGLVATGAFMISYMSGKRRTWDYVLSTIGGVLVTVIALVPTARHLDDPNFHPSGTSCTVFPGPPYCNGFENSWGEDTARLVHQSCAVGFVVVLFFLIIVFALREFGYGPGAEALCGAERNVSTVRATLKAEGVGLVPYLLRGTGVARPRRRTLLYLTMALLILLAGIWSAVGVDIPWFRGYEFAPTWVTEFVSFNAFGIAWVASSIDLGFTHRTRLAAARLLG